MFAKLALGSVAAQLALGAGEEDFMAKNGENRRMLGLIETTNAAITATTAGTMCPGVHTIGAAVTPTAWTEAQLLAACNQTHCAWGKLAAADAGNKCRDRVAEQAVCAALTTSAACVVDTNICVWDSAATTPVCKAPDAVAAATAAGSGAAVPKAVGGAAIVATLLFHLL